MIMPGRAVAALQAVVLPERLLHRVQGVLGAHALDRRDLARRRPARRARCSTSPRRRRDGTVHAPQLDVSQPTCVPGQAELVAEEVHEQLARLHLLLVPHAVDRHRTRAIQRLLLRRDRDLRYPEPKCTVSAGGGTRAPGSRAAGGRPPGSRSNCTPISLSVTRITRARATTSWLATVIVSSSGPPPGIGPLAADADAAGADVAGRRWSSRRRCRSSARARAAGSARARTRAAGRGGCRRSAAARPPRQTER